MSRWHDRLKAEARTCLAKQVTESDKRLPKAGLNTASLASGSTRPCSAKAA